MTKDDGKQWLMELTQNITNQLKESKTEINNLWEVINKNRDMHTNCREQVLDRLANLDNEFSEKFADLDKRLEVTIIKVGAVMGALIVLGEYLFGHLLGK